MLIVAVAPPWEFRRLGLDFGCPSGLSGDSSWEVPEFRSLLEVLEARRLGNLVDCAVPRNPSKNRYATV